MKKILVMLLVLATIFSSSLSVYALDTSAACSGVGVINGTGSCSSGSGVNSLAGSVVNILSIVIGIVATIMIIMAGFKYITSAGDSNKVGSAKKTLINALVGVVLVVLAQFLVHFVINTTSKAAGNGLLPVINFRGRA